jgi:hypothetical protein
VKAELFAAEQLCSPVAFSGRKGPVVYLETHQREKGSKIIGAQQRPADGGTARAVEDRSR